MMVMEKEEKEEEEEKGKEEEHAGRQEEGDPVFAILTLTRPESASGQETLIYSFSFSPFSPVCLSVCLSLISFSSSSPVTLPSSFLFRTRCWPCCPCINEGTRTWSGVNNRFFLPSSHSGILFVVVVLSVLFVPSD